MDNEELIPLEHVLEDMQDGSGVECAARDYYYQHYCTPEERAQMERWDKIEAFTYIAALIAIIIIAGM